MQTSDQSEVANGTLTQIRRPRPTATRDRAKPDALVQPHLEYLRLGKTAVERQAAYRQLFKYHIAESSLNEIREATNKAWVLGNDRFKQRVQKQLERRVEPSARGGDRKSEKFRINRV